MTSTSGTDLEKLKLLEAVTISAYSKSNWKLLPIQECGEKLVQVDESMVFPFYAREMKLTKDERIFLRESVYKKFLFARELLHKQGLELKVYDGWRSVELQENLFWFYMKKFTAAKFNLADSFANFNSPDEIKKYFNSLPSELKNEMIEQNLAFVSLPSSDPKCPSPHVTGGSIDVWLFENGEPVDLGVPFDWMEENAGAFYHIMPNRVKFSGDDAKICGNRTKLILAMSEAGFSCYAPEFWHFNYGNQMDALVSGSAARYSYIEPGYILLKEV